jgi:signal peptidase II
MVALDQVTKYWAETNLTLGGPSIHLIGDFFMLTLIYNEGGALGTNFGSSTYYLVISLVVLLCLFYYTWLRRRDLSLVLPFALIISGAAGNLIDRIRIGRVVDFLDVDFFDMFGMTRWWTFNVADACISVAVLFLLVKIFFFTPEHSPPSIQDSESPASANQANH